MDSKIKKYIVVAILILLGTIVGIFVLVKSGQIGIGGLFDTKNKPAGNSVSTEGAAAEPETVPQWVVEDQKKIGEQTQNENDVPVDIPLEQVIEDQQKTVGEDQGQDADGSQEEMPLEQVIEDQLRTVGQE